MSKAILISIRPQWVEKIINGDKTIEVRRTAPKLEMPFKCYFYMTKTKERCRFWEYMTAYQNSKGEILDGSQKVIGEFVCDKVSRYGDYEGKIDSPYFITPEQLKQTCLTYGKFKEYGRNDILYGWHISDLVIYDKPKELGEFRKPCGLGTGCEECDDIYLMNCKNTLARPFQSWGYVCSNE